MVELDARGCGRGFDGHVEGLRWHWRWHCPNEWERTLPPRQRNSSLERGRAQRLHNTWGTQDRHGQLARPERVELGVLAPMLSYAAGRGMVKGI